MRWREPKTRPEVKINRTSFLNIARKQLLKVNSSKIGANITDATKI